MGNQVAPSSPGPHPGSSSEVHSRRLSGVGHRPTSPELALRRSLHSRAYRFRVGYPVPGLPRRSIDIAFVRWRVAVFVDGCFWHRCPVHGTASRANSEWWNLKLDGNVRRDGETSAYLSSKGWIVVRLWEHEPVAQAVEAVEAALRAARHPRALAPFHGDPVDEPPDKSGRTAVATCMLGAGV